MLFIDLKDRQHNARCSTAAPTALAVSIPASAEQFARAEAKAATAEAAQTNGGTLIALQLHTLILSCLSVMCVGALVIARMHTRSLRSSDALDLLWVL